MSGSLNITDVLLVSCAVLGLSEGPIGSHGRRNVRANVLMSEHHGGGCNVRKYFVAWRNIVGYGHRRILRRLVLARR